MAGSGRDGDGPGGCPCRTAVPPATVAGGGTQRSEARGLGPADDPAALEPVGDAR